LIEGTTDSELMFNLALTFGLESDPIAALERMTGFVEVVGHRNGIQYPLQMTLGLSDGQRLFAVRYSSEQQSRSLYHSGDIAALKEVSSSLRGIADDARAIVCEPLSQMSKMWEPVPESSVIVVDSGKLATQPFNPR